jgi:hypothetical protein
MDSIVSLFNMIATTSHSDSIDQEKFKDPEV